MTSIIFFRNGYFMNKSSKLCDLNPNESAYIGGILHTCPIKRRLYDIGLTEGTLVKCLYRNPGNNMKAYLIRGAIIAIRNEDCAHVTLEGRFENNEDQ
jgi:ferrous iron transport protein A